MEGLSKTAVVFDGARDKTALKLSGIRSVVCCSYIDPAATAPDVDERHFKTSVPFAKEKWGGDRQAGKDVYCEKPISHNIIEGRRMIKTARRNNRVVATGTQRRSGALLARSVKFLRDGGLGNLYSGRAVIYRPRDPIGVAADSPLPPGVHYDQWLGPAPARAFNENHFHVPEAIFTSGQDIVSSRR